MKRNEIAAQLYCFRNYIRTEAGIADTFRRLREIGYESVQLTSAFPETLTTARLDQLLKDHGLAALSSHESGPKIFSEPERIIGKLRELGVAHVAYPATHLHPTGVAEVVDFARQLNALALKFREAGIVLAFHNHDKEFRRFEGKLMLDLVFDNAPDLEGEIDTHWVQRGGGDPEKWVRRLAGRMRAIHLKDYGVDTADCRDFWSNVPVMKPVGSGNLDWRGIIGAAEECGVRYFVVEHDQNVTDPFASFAESFRYLSENFVR